MSHKESDSSQQQQKEKSHSGRSKKNSGSHKADSASGTSKSNHKSEVIAKQNSKSGDPVNRVILLHGPQKSHSLHLEGKDTKSYSKSQKGSKSSSSGQHQRSKSQGASAPTAISNIAGLQWSQNTGRSNLGPVHIGNLTKLHFLQKSVMHSRMTPAFGEKSSKIGGKSSVARSRERIDPRKLKHNDNLPLEASAAYVIDQKEVIPLVPSGLRSGKFDDALLPAVVFNCDVRLEFQAKVMRSLSGTIYDPCKFLQPVSDSQKEKNYLERHVNPFKLIDFMVHHMDLYYNLESDDDAFSSRRQEMDNYLWDNLAFIIPILCRQVIDVFATEPMILIGIEPDVIVFGDVHGNGNDIYYIWHNFINKPEYANTKFLFLGDYVDRGPKPVDILCFLFALKLSNPKRFYCLRGNHEVLKINRKYGFQHMCCHLFLDTYISKPTLAELNYKSFNRAFCYMPVGAVIKGSESSSGGKGIFCCHGGVPSYHKDDEKESKSSKSGSSKVSSRSSKSSSKNPEMPVGWSIANLNAALKKPLALAPSRHCMPAERAFNEILWNDPIPPRLRDPEKYPKKYYVNKKRGGHCSFFTEAGLKAFLETNNLSMVIRGHQFKRSMENGYYYEFNNALLTVFSSSNYCGTEENDTGYVHVTGTHCQVKAHTLRTAKEAEKYREFNILKIIVDEHTKEVTQVAF